MNIVLYKRKCQSNDCLPLKRFLQNGYDDYFEETKRITGTFRERIDVFNFILSIDLSAFGSEWTQFIYYHNFNMIRIVEWNRFYDVLDISIEGKFCYISCRTNMLYSAVFTKLLDNVTCFATRNEERSDKFIVDDYVFSEIGVNSYFFDYKSCIICTVNGNKSLSELTGNSSFSGGCYLLSTFNELETGSVISDTNGTPTLGNFNQLYCFNNKSKFQKLFSFITAPNFWESLYVGFSNINDFIGDVSYSPIDFISLIKNPSPDGGVIGERNEFLFFGNKSVNNSEYDGYIIYDHTRLKFYFEINDEIIISNFTYFNPFSKYFLFLPFYGFVELDDQRIQNNSYKYIVYDVDVSTGDFIVTLSVEAPIYNTPIIFSLDCWKGNLYTKIPMGSTNLNEVHRNSALLAANATASLISVGNSSLKKISSGSKKLTPKTKKISKAGMRMIEAGKEEFIQGIFDISNSSLLSGLTDLISSGNFNSLNDSSLIYRFYNNEPYILQFQNKYYYPQSYGKFFGFPFNDSDLFNNFRGFTVITEIIIPNAFDFIRNIDGFEARHYGLFLDSEIEELREILATGVYL